MGRGEKAGPGTFALIGSELVGHAGVFGAKMGFVLCSEGGAEMV